MTVAILLGAAVVAWAISSVRESVDAINRKLDALLRAKAAPASEADASPDEGGGP